MPEPRIVDPTVKELIIVCNRLIDSHAKSFEISNALLLQSTETLKVLREQNEAQRLRNEKTENFLFVGDPAKNVPSFVAEVRDGLDTNKSRWDVVIRVAWIMIGTFVAGGAAALMWWKPAP